MNTEYESFLHRSNVRWGSDFNPVDLDQRFVPFLRSQARIKVDTCGMTVTGTVGVTTGWKPVFILLRNSRSIGSSWTLGPKDKIIAVKNPGCRYYIPYHA